VDIADKTRLSKLLGMLGSSFDGERATAAAMIQKMAEKYKLTINELVDRAHGAPAQAFKKPPPQSASPNSQNIFSDDALSALELALKENSRWMTPWERQFAEDVTNKYGRDYELSPKQMAVIERIIGKINRYHSNGKDWGDV
jgi:hypothetical protein